MHRHPLLFGAYRVFNEVDDIHPPLPIIRNIP